MTLSKNESAMESKMKVLIFFLNDVRFAIPVSDLVEINRIAKFRQIEKGPDWVVGMINFHGKTTPVLSLKCLLSMEPSNLGPMARWLAVKYDDMFVCLTVDEVKGFMDLDRQIIDEMPLFADGPEPKYFRCYARIDNKIVPVLDFRRILKEKEPPIESLHDGEFGGIAE